MRTIDEGFTRAADPAVSPASAVRTLDGRTILVATDGAPESAAAVHVAFALARRRGARPEVLRTFEAGELFAPDFTLDDASPILRLADDLLGAEPHEARKQELRAALGQQLGAIPDWPAHVRVGSPAGSIVREAEAIGAALIVVGLRRHGVGARAFRDETGLLVARAARVPVLAVGAGLETLPRKVVVGVDFSRASLHAARAALSVMDERGTLVLAYARPAARDDDESCEGIGDREPSTASAAFERLRADLAAPAGITVESLVLIGDPAAELRTLAERDGVDLVAVGSHRHETNERWRLGSVTADLLRDGRTSVLVVPPTPANRSVQRYQ